jgi:hypothetical protein
LVLPDFTVDSKKKIAIRVRKTRSIKNKTMELGKSLPESNSSRAITVRLLDPTGSRSRFSCSLHHTK